MCKTEHHPVLIGLGNYEAKIGLACINLELYA